MSFFQLILNLLWIVTGGVWMAAGWLLAAVLMALTIVGLPWTRAAFNIAAYTLVPFGHRAVSRAEWTGQEDLGTGPLGMLGNILWLVIAGWWLALGHLIHRHRLGFHDHRHPVCVGPFEIGQPGALADREGDRSGRREPVFPAFIEDFAQRSFHFSACPAIVSRITHKHDFGLMQPIIIVIQTNFPGLGRGLRTGKTTGALALATWLAPYLYPSRIES